jgi:hypothetical protein
MNPKKNEQGMNTTKSMSAYVAQREHEARNKKSDEPDLPNVALGKYAFASSEQRNDNKVCTPPWACGYQTDWAHQKL